MYYLVEIVDDVTTALTSSLTTLAKLAANAGIKCLQNESAGISI